MCMCMYIYIYREREREREIHICMCIYVCIYIYTHIYMYIYIYICITYAWNTTLREPLVLPPPPSAFLSSKHTTKINKQICIYVYIYIYVCIHANNKYANIQYTGHKTTNMQILYSLCFCCCFPIIENTWYEHLLLRFVSVCLNTCVILLSKHVLWANR